MSSLGLKSLSADAINYYAFDIASEGFMDELYGHFASCCMNPTFNSEKKKPVSVYEKDIKEKLEELLPNLSTKNWIKVTRGQTTPSQVPTCIYVRNSVHHPENGKNSKYTYSELEEAISQLEKAILKTRKVLGNFDCNCRLNVNI